VRYTVGVMSETAAFSREQHLYLAWPSGGRGWFEMPECSQTALGYAQRLAADPFALSPPSGAREAAGFSITGWPHVGRASLFDSSSLL
jgi:hypothetical protein